MNRTRRSLLPAVAGVVVLPGCVDLGDDEDGEFRIEELAFASEEPTGYDDYDPQPDATYERGETAWFYVGVRDGTPEDGVVTFETVFEVRPPEGDPVTGEGEVDVDVSGEVSHERMFVTNGYYTTPGFPEGTYEVAVELTDVHSGTTDQVSGEFELA